MKINWTVRLKNKAFWLGLIPAVLLLAQQLCALCGVNLDVSGLSEQLIGICGTVFAVLALLGVVNDPTTKGIADSDRAMEYEKPSEGDGE